MKNIGLFLIIMFLVGLAGAQEEEENAVKVKLDGYYRVRGISITDAVYLDENGQRVKEDKSAYIQQRFRLEPEIQIIPDELSLKMQADIFDDVIWGDNSCYVTGVYDASQPGCNLPALAGSPSNHGLNYLYQYEDRMLVVKRAWAEVKLPVGKLAFGRMPSHWGLGLLENDGNGFRNEWGDAHYGDTRDRIEFVTKPGGKDRPYYLAIGYDKTVEGEIPQMPGQPIDDVDQWFIVPFYCAPDCLAKPPQVNTFGGAFVAYRVQPASDTKVIVSDGYFMQKIDQFKIQADVLYLGGATKALGDFDGDGVVDNITVNVINGVLRGTYTMEPFQGILEVGYAGGDKDASYRDRRITAYTWDPDYNVGLLMFEELQARQSAGFARMLNQTGELTDDLIPLVTTKGGVKNATYVLVTPKFFLGEEENPLLVTKLSFLWAQLNEPDLNPLPAKTTYLNGEGSRDLGFELDWGIEFGTNFKLGVQLGYLWAGKAFQDTNGDTQNMFTSQLRLTVPF